MNRAKPKSDDIVRCQGCLWPRSQGHQWRCPEAPLEEKAAGAEREIEQYWKPEVERYKGHAKRSHDAIARFQGKYMVVRHENNMLRRKLYRQGG